MASWDFWVANENYGDMPKKRNDKETPEGSVAPIPVSFVSPWIGKTLRECARWLQKAPKDVAVNRRYFTALIEDSKGEDTVLVCRIAQSPKSGDVEVEYFPQPTDLVALHMVTNDDTRFDEKALVYRRSLRSSTVGN